MPATEAAAATALAFRKARLSSFIVRDERRGEHILQPMQGEERVAGARLAGRFDRYDKPAVARLSVDLDARQAEHRGAQPLALARQRRDDGANDFYSVSAENLPPAPHRRIAPERCSIRLIWIKSR